jgi:HD-GYP domain-containing protein (c-di-GMP phosphodiesterase class II)
LPNDKRRWLKRAALLHDIGKVAISNSILDKPGKLTDDEFAKIKTHPVHSFDILSGVSVFADMAATARSHHERLDGKGYPDGLSSAQISLDTRIITTADVFDALTADRPYRKAMPIPLALDIMARDVGTAFDPVCFDALKRALTSADAAAAA